MNTFNENENVRAVIVGLELPGQTGNEASIEELARLIDTAGGECFAAVTQNREAPDVRTCIGKGKIEELNLSKTGSISLSGVLPDGREVHIYTTPAKEGV